MDVSAIFELPVHIWVMFDALAAKYSTGYGELRFSVVLPTDQPPLGGAPDAVSYSANDLTRIAMRAAEIDGDGFDEGAVQALSEIFIHVRGEDRIDEVGNGRF